MAVLLIVFPDVVVLYCVLLLIYCCASAALTAPHAGLTLLRH
jgi:hypothetical protein